MTVWEKLPILWPDPLAQKMMGDPRLHSESLSPSAGLFTLPLLMIGISSALVSKKSHLHLLLGGFLLIQSSASPDIFAVSEILNLVDLGPTPT